MKIAILLLIVLLFSGCAFVNTLYNGATAFRQAQRIENLGARTSRDSLSIVRETTPLYRRAIEKADKVLLEFPRSERAQPNAYFLKGVSLFALGEYANAINSFEVILEFYPESRFVARSLLHLAKAFSRLEDYLIAQNFLETLLEQFPEMATDQRVVMLRADLAVQLEGRYAAIEALERRLAETNDPLQRLTIIERLMRLTMEQGEFERAIAYTQNMPSFNRRHWQIYYRIEFRKLQALREVLRRRDAIALADAMLANPSYLYNRSEIMLEKAMILVDMTEYREAMRIFEDIIALQGDPRIRGRTWFEFANVNIDFMGNLDSGRVQLDSALVLAGNDQEFRETILRRLNGLHRIAQLQEAIDTTDAFARLDTAYFRYKIGESYWLSVDLPDSALVFFNKVVNSPTAADSIRAQALFSVAFILRTVKNDTLASDSIFNEIIHRFPRFEAAKASQEMLGLPVTIMTRRDSANVQFLLAERIFLDLDSNEFSYDAYYNYLLTALRFPDIDDVAARALFAAGMLVNRRGVMDDGSADTAAVKIFVRLCRDYPKSEQCRAAQVMMNVGEVQSFATEFTARIEAVEAMQIEEEVARISEVPEENRAILPDFQSWI